MPLSTKDLNNIEKLTRRVVQEETGNSFEAFEKRQEQTTLSYRKLCVSGK